jgi:hypothetical protein
VLSFSIMHFYVLHFTGNISKTQMKKWLKFEHFLSFRTKWKVKLKTLNTYFR